MCKKEEITWIWMSQYVMNIGAEFKKMDVIDERRKK
jgi:hypothetical protein